MPHQCTRCGKIYDDGDKALLEGCSCGGKFFFFIKKEKLEKLKKEQNKILNLTKEERKQIEEDVYELLGVDKEEEQPIILDIEAIKIDKPGKYELDLVKLMSDKPLIYKIGEGKYMIDLAESFAKLKREKEKN